MHDNPAMMNTIKASKHVCSCMLIHVFPHLMWVCSGRRCPVVAMSEICHIPHHVLLHTACVGHYLQRSPVIWHAVLNHMRARRGAASHLLLVCCSIHPRTAFVASGISGPWNNSCLLSGNSCILVSMLSASSNRRFTASMGAMLSLVPCTENNGSFNCLYFGMSSSIAFLARNANFARTLPVKTSGSAKYAATASGSMDMSFGSTAGAMRAIGIIAAARPDIGARILRARFRLTSMAADDNMRPLYWV
mmetsp:Transcript_6384/g.12962  ORF Transcript_6384/g.12962 Transcript_6384/m.12962 type:complete len:248 (+) Transcript_6384:193-936(+)